MQTSRASRHRDPAIAGDPSAPSGRSSGAVRAAAVLLAACAALAGVLALPAPLIAQTNAAASAPAAAAQGGQALAAQMIRDSFRTEGQALVGWLDQDLAQKACSGDKPPSAEVAKQIEAEALASVKWPTDNRFLGDWKRGEKIAQSGRGMTWSDKEGSEAGGGCYNCHQLDKAEISYGTIGPSLAQFGKLRGVANPTDPAAEPIVRYTWSKLWNAKAFNACSGMPRIGHKGILTMEQLQDVMALLLDPKSPVNQ